MPTMMEFSPLVISFILLALTLVLFISERRLSVLLASIAGIGGFLSYVIFAAFLDKEVSTTEYSFWFVYYGLPMILVFSYQKVEAHIDAENLRRITPAERVRGFQAKQN